jgi:hypothetical protein
LRRDLYPDFLFFQIPRQNHVLDLFSDSSLSATGNIYILYRAALNEQRMLLVGTAQSQTRVIEAIARFSAIHNKDYPGGPLSETISQIADAHRHYKGSGKTGEFTLANLHYRPPFR